MRKISNCKQDSEGVSFLFALVVQTVYGTKPRWATLVSSTGKRLTGSVSARTREELSPVSHHNPSKNQLPESSTLPVRLENSVNLLPVSGLSSLGNVAVTVPTGGETYVVTNGQVRTEGAESAMGSFPSFPLQGNHEVTLLISKDLNLDLSFSDSEAQDSKQIDIVSMVASIAVLVSDDVHAVVMTAAVMVMTLGSMAAGSL